MFTAGIPTRAVSRALLFLLSGSNPFAIVSNGCHHQPAAVASVGLREARPQPSLPYCAARGILSYSAHVTGSSRLMVGASANSGRRF